MYRQPLPKCVCNNRKHFLYITFPARHVPPNHCQYKTVKLYRIPFCFATRATISPFLSPPSKTLWIIWKDIWLAKKNYVSKVLSTRRAVQEWLCVVMAVGVPSYDEIEIACWWELCRRKDWSIIVMNVFGHKPDGFAGKCHCQSFVFSSSVSGWWPLALPPPPLDVFTVPGGSLGGDYCLCCCMWMWQRWQS